MGKRNCGLRYAFRIAVGITLLVLLLGNSASATTIIVPDDYAKIQWAINAATAGDTIEVHSGTYYENVNVNKQLTLRGIGMPVVKAGEGNSCNSVITLSADGIILEGFNVFSIAKECENPGGDVVGIMVTSNKNTLIGNYAKISGSEAGFNAIAIFLSSSSNNTLSENNANSNKAYGYGVGISIFLSSSNNNTLISNNASFNGGDYNGGVGIILISSNNNTLIGNNANSNTVGISLSLSSNNTLIGNNANGNRGLLCGCNHDRGPGIGISLYSSNNNKLIGNNAILNYAIIAGGYLVPYEGGVSISLSSSGNNVIYNNIFNNSEFEDSNINNWNITKQSGSNIIGGPYLGGNFWAQTDGNGYSQTCPDANRDGICDSPYILDANNIDYLPLTYIPAGVDIDPDTLNKASQGGVVTAYIEIPGYDVNDIDVSTVTLSTNNGMVSAQLSSTVVGDYDSDGIPDLMVKFDRQAVIGIVDVGDHVKLTISGMVSGLEFKGSDEIRVIGDQPPSPVPEQSSIVLVSAGLLGILLVLRRSK